MVPPPILLADAAATNPMEIFCTIGLDQFYEEMNDQDSYSKLKELLMKKVRLEMRVSISLISVFNLQSILLRQRKLRD